ncbi:hypothetical protein L9F63_021608, partial [Diploptera punctata]
LITRCGHCEIVCNEIYTSPRLQNSAHLPASKSTFKFLLECLSIPNLFPSAPKFEERAFKGFILCVTYFVPTHQPVQLGQFPQRLQLILVSFSNFSPFTHTVAGVVLVTPHRATGSSEYFIPFNKIFTSLGTYFFRFRLFINNWKNAKLTLYPWLVTHLKQQKVSPGVVHTVGCTICSWKICDEVVKLERGNSSCLAQLLPRLTNNYYKCTDY